MLYRNGHTCALAFSRSPRVLLHVFGALYRRVGLALFYYAAAFFDIFVFLGATIYYDVRTA